VKFLSFRIGASLARSSSVIAASLRRFPNRKLTPVISTRPLGTSCGWALVSHPDAEEAARRLLARPRTPSLTPAQAETLSIVAYLQPVSRPEVARIRGVASESATTALVERGVIEEAGRSQFGAVLYRTTPVFLRAFGLASLDELPDPGRWDPSPEDEASLRDRLLRAGEGRSTPPGG